MQKFLPLVVSTAVGLTGIMIATNPTREAYSHHLVARVIDDTQSTVCGGGGGSGSPNNEVQFPSLADLCDQALLGLGSWQYDRLQKTVKAATQKQQYFLFTVYETNLMGRRYRTLAMLGQFIPLDEQNVQQTAEG